jgi:hypothetical protein
MTHRLLLCALAAVLAGCATAPSTNYGAFYENQPRSILVVPAGNATTAVDSPETWSTTITMPLAERGYYVFPIYLTNDLLKDLGLHNEGLLAQVPPSRFREVFGADAILFVTIHDWTTKYLVLASNVTVDVSYRLVDTRTGRVLWETQQQAIRQSNGGGVGLGALVVAAVNALITTTIDYRPLAREANIRAVDEARRGLPAGPYHVDFQKDQGKYK